MNEEPEPNDAEQRAGELPVGFVTFNNLPYDLTQKEVAAMRKEIREREARRIPPGFAA